MGQIIHNTDYLIIGNSAGGIGAIEAIREVDKAGSITIVSDEPYPSYSRPLISKYLSKERSFDDMLYRPSDFYEKCSVDTLLGQRVSTVMPGDSAVALDDGGYIGWKRLLLACGGMPIVPKIENIDKQGVFNFTTLDDAKAIDEFLENVNSAVVIGGGLIGVSVTEALVKRGVDVTVVEMKDRILNTILDEESSFIAQQSLESSGVNIITGDSVASINGDGCVAGVMLKGGTEISCELVIVAIGVLPRTELVKGTNIRVNQGVVVDRYMETNHPGIYACGDAAEAYDFVLGINRPIPIWPNAYIGGRVAGLNMAGVSAVYSGGTAMSSLNYFGLDIIAAGLTTASADGSYECLCKRGNGRYFKLLLKDNVIVGMICVSEIEKAGILFNLMKEKVDVTEFKDNLLDDDLGLVDLPRGFWQERILAPSRSSTT
jgi:NAD(P)H-nitrite reductase large subunit